MKVRMLVEMSGTRDGQPWPPRGALVDLPDVEAMELLASRMAAPVADLAADVELRPASVVNDELRDDGPLVVAGGDALARRGAGRPRKDASV